MSSDRLSVGLLFVFIATLACLAPAQSDTWWHLRGGQDIWRNASVNLYDTYSFTARGALWPNHEWLTEVIFYALYVAGGLVLLSAACAVAVIVAWAMSWQLASGRLEVRLLLFTFAVAAATTHWALRPQVFSMALLAATVSLLVARRYVWLPLMFVVWTNLHGGVALGIVAVAAALLVSLITRQTSTRWLMLAAAGCVLATLVSPLGVSFWPEVLQSIERSRVSDLVEWHRPPFAPTLLGFWVIAVALPVLLAFRWRQLDDGSKTLSAIAVAMLPLALSSFRNVSTFLLIAAPAVSALVGSRTRERAIPRPAKENTRGNLIFFAIAASVAATVVGVSWWRPALRLGWEPISAAAIRTIAKCDGPLYNSYESGGILIWFVPETPVFVDNRQDPYTLDFLATIHRVERDGRYEELFDRYQPRCALTGSNSAVATRLQADTAWSEQYTDASWVIFKRR
jgi:hypothetical protein